MKKIVNLLLVCVLFVPYQFAATTELPGSYRSPSVKLTDRELHCLAENIYYEAGNQAEIGQVAVAFVTINRLREDRYPNDMCRVVNQKRKGVCQFSWVCENKIRSKKDPVLWRTVKSVARYVAFGYNTHIKDPTNGALFYHADYVRPIWRLALDRTIKIGAHIFYREKNTT